MLEIIRSHERGQAHFGWLNSRHTFSFGHYYNPQQMGFSALRVINDDEVMPAAGFDTHSHHNMEIISYVLSGAIVHKDSEGNAAILPAGEFQLMSAGRGIQHSEFNASQQDVLTFLQIWIRPNQQNGQPSYQQKRFALDTGFTAIVTPDGRDGTLHIKQDAYLSHLQLAPQQSWVVPLQADRHYYLHLIEGELSLEQQHLRPGDGVKITQNSQLTLAAHTTQVKALWFDLPEHA